MPSRVPSFRSPSLAGDRHREYDRFARDREAKRFYDSGPWRKLRAWKLATDPLCERCKASGRYVAASHVHHRTERSEAPELALDEANLESLCHPCHSRHHATRGKEIDANR
jgi:5-methylcytosine-specific restriction protein A